MTAGMKSYALALAVGAVCTAASAQDAAPGASQNQLRGVYVSGAGGLNWVEDGDAAVFLGSGFNTTIATKAELDRGWAADAAIGYAWKSLFRTEIEGSFRRNDPNSIPLLPLSANRITGEVDTWAVMANVLNDFPVNSWLSPYLGGGVGYADVKLKAACAPNASFCRYDDKNGSFAYQVIAGASVRLSANVQLFADYHYFGVRDLNFDASSFGDRISAIKYRNHSVFFGIRVAFGRPPPPVKSAPEAETPQS